MKSIKNLEGWRSTESEVRENFYGHLDNKRPLAEVVDDLEKGGIQVVRKIWSVEKHGVRFIDQDLAAKDDNKIVDETRHYQNFIKKIREDYSLLCYAWNALNPNHLTRIINSIFASNLTIKKKGQHQLSSRTAPGGVNGANRPLSE